MRFIRRFAFSTLHDPYYVLGIDKNLSFNEIKKAYYKLAAQYHPDINKSPNAESQFLVIKEAFEKIKVQKGEAVEMHSQSTTQQNYQSVRKNYKDYQENAQDSQKKTDYQEFIHKTQNLEGEFYDTLRQSFKTVDSIQDIKFKPIDMKMPDPSKRFNLSKVMHLKTLSDGSSMYIVLVSGIFLFLLYIVNKSFNKYIVQKNENQIYAMVNQVTIKDEIDEDQLIENLEFSLKNQSEYKAYQRAVEEKQKKARELRLQFMPDVQNFVSTSEFNESVL